MASTIKGITVKIAGDTMDLQKSLKAVQSSSANLQKELSAINRQLSFDPENTVLLAQKQEVLQEQIDKSQSALERLLDVQEQVEEQAKNSDISTEQYRAYQREVEKTKNKLENFKKQLAETEEKANSISLESARAEMSKTETSVDKAGDSLKNLENKSNNTDLSKVKKEMDGIKSSANELKTAVGDALKEAGVAVTAAGGALTGTVVSANSEQKALNSLQAQAGLTAEEMTKYKDVLEDVYKGNFGESQEEVANTLALIKQTTNETNPDKLKSMTENLFTLSDTFGYDYSETLRAVNMMMEQFGITGEEAFNLIAQGTQDGLNKNGDFLDTLNEYSVHYKQLGYNAEEFINSLKNGSEAGTFSIDKLGDAMKEFGIRSKDTASSTTEGFELIGLDADEMRKKFSKGGDSARAATSEVLKALFKMDDQVKQNQAGVDLFGTMWEDLGIDGVKALMKVNGSADKTKNTMKKIKDIKYDDVESDWESLGRTVQTDVINPIGKSLFPEVKKLCKFAEKHTNDIIPTLKIVGSLVGGIWVGKKTTAVVNGVKSLIGAYKSLKTTTEAAKIAQEGLNLAQKSNVIGIVVGLAATLAGTFISLATSNDEASESQEKLTEKQEKAREEIEELKNANDEYVQSKKDAASEVESEFQYYEDLWGELKTIVDENGKVKKGYEDRAKFITNELSRVTGDEIEWNGGVIQSYKDLKSSIDDALKSKKALALLSAYEDSYQTAVSGLGGAKNDVVNQNAIVHKNKIDVSNARDSVNSLQIHDTKAENVAWWAYENKSIDKHTLGIINAYSKGEKVDKEELGVAQNRIKALETAYDQELKNRKNVLSQRESELKDAEDKYKKYQEKVVQYNTTIQNVENLTAATAKGNTKEIEATMSDLSNNIVTYTTGTKETLEQQVNDFKTNAENLKTALEDGVEGVTETHVKEAEELQERAELELAMYNDVYGTAAAIASQKSDEIKASQQKIKDGFIDAENGSKESLENQVTNLQANYELLKTAMDEGQPGVTQKMVDNAHELVDKATEELNKLEDNGEDAAEKGVKKTADTIGSKESKEKIKGSTKDVVSVTTSDDIITFVNSMSVMLGQCFSSGMSNGITSALASVGNSAAQVALEALKSVQKTQDSHSPSKKTQKLGKYFAQGYQLGIKDEIAETQKTVKNLTTRAIAAAEGNPIDVINSKFAGIRTNSENAIANQAMPKFVTNSPSVEIKLTGDVIINNDMDVDDFNRRVSAAIVETLDSEAARWGG